MDEGVTIAIPNWNHELLLPRSIGSAMKGLTACRERGWEGEVIVVDDASRDGSQTLLRQWEAIYYKDGLKVLPFRENAGLAATRNQALLAARYRYIVFLDADNEILPENLPLFVETLKETRAAATYGNLLVRTLGSRESFDAISNECVHDRLFAGNYIDAFAVFDRAQLLDAGGYSALIPVWEDYAQWLHFATNGREIVFVPAVLGYYYLLPGSMITTIANDTKTQSLNSQVTRVYDQLKSRSHLPLNTRHRRYHPALGYL
jgi:succinoglycan biosynthesis protein ExoO